MAKSQATDLSQEDYRYTVAKKVFDDLVEAKSVRNMPVPVFRLVDTERNVAWSKKKTAEIGLEKKAYAICVSFGPDSLNAIAAILAHELTHYYEKHGWTELFAAAHIEMESAHELMNTDEHLAQEIQADYLGGFLAHAAGYQVLDIMPLFLEKVYKVYGFSSEMKGYPSLPERKEMATSALKKSTMLSRMFDMANYMVAMGEFNNASFYYQYILKDFQSREMYNNLGIVAAMEATNLFSKKELSFVYPFELDANSRLNNDTKGGEGDFAEQRIRRKKLLQEAIQYFETALLLDDTYASAYLNTACAYALLNETEDATYFARKALKKAKKLEQKNTIADTHILLGIIASLEGDKEEAQQYLAKAIAGGSEIAKLNLVLLEGGDGAAGKSIPTVGTVAKKETIDAVSIDKLVHQLEREELEPTALIELDAKTVFAYLEKENSTVLIHLRPYTEEYLIVHLTQDNYQETLTNGLKIGSQWEEVKQTYGSSGRQIQLGAGLIQLYLKGHVLFCFDDLHRVRRWGIFQKSK